MTGLVAEIPGLLYRNVWSPAWDALNDFTLATARISLNETSWNQTSITIDLSPNVVDMIMKLKVIVVGLVAFLSLGIVLYLVNELYGLLCKPMNRIRKLGSIGYLQSEDGKMSKRDIANMLRKRRKIGEDLPPVYPNGWFRLLDSQQLGVGQVKEVTAMGEHFAVYRGKSGKAHILDAYCPHMGSNMAQGGRVEGDCLECPFHGWAFSGSGKCTKIPYAKKVPEFIKTKSWDVREINGGIYVWYHCDGKAPEWEIPEVKEATDPGHTYVGRVEHHANTHIQDIPENGSDVAHFGHVHMPHVFTGNNLAFAFDSFWNFVVHTYEAECKGTVKGKSHIMKFFLIHSMQFFKKWKWFHINLEVFQIGPGIVHLHYKGCFGDGVFVQSVLPMEPLHLMITHTLYASRKYPFFLAKLFLYFEALQVDRDIMIWNNKTFQKRPMFMKEDGLIPKFRKWFSQFYTENSPRLTIRQEDTTSW